MRNKKWTGALISLGFFLISCGGVNFSLVPPMKPLVEKTVSGTGENKILLIVTHLIFIVACDCE